MAGWTRSLTSKPKTTIVAMRITTNGKSQQSILTRIPVAIGFAALGPFRCKG